MYSPFSQIQVQYSLLAQVQIQVSALEQEDYTLILHLYLRKHVSASSAHLKIVYEQIYFDTSLQTPVSVSALEQKTLVHCILEKEL